MAFRSQYVPSDAQLPLAVQRFTTPGADTYTPTPGTRSFVVELVGAGGGSGAAVQSVTDIGIGCGGCSGAYARKRYTTVAGSYALVVGAGGTAGLAAGPVTGGDGADTTFDTGAIVAGGGQGGGADTGVPPKIVGSGFPGIATGGDINSFGNPSTPAIGLALTVSIMGGTGGAGWMGGGGRGACPSGGVPDPEPGRPYGGGAGGAAVAANTADKDGRDGADGIIIITEYA